MPMQIFPCPSIVRQMKSGGCPIPLKAMKTITPRGATVFSQFLFYCFFRRKFQISPSFSNAL